MSDEADKVRDACKADPFFFATRFVHTRDPQADNPVRRFPAYPYLEKTFAHWREHQLTAAPKSRQMLLTWAAVVFLIWECAFRSEREWIVQSEKDEKAKAVNERAIFVLNHVEPWLIGRHEWRATASRIVFNNGSTLRAVPQGPKQIASYSPSGIVFDEMALQDDAKEAYETALPAVRNGGKIIGISSPRGQNFFHQFCFGIQAVHSRQIHYKDHPVYAEQARAMGGWAIWKKEMMVKWGYDEATWEREMEINFDMAGGIPAFKPPFRRETHVATKQMVPNPTAPIQRGLDLGYNSPACVWTQVAANGQWVVLREFQGHQMQLVDFVREVKRRSKRLAPWARRNDFMDYADPEAYKKSATGPSAIDVLREQGIFPLNSSSKIDVESTVRLVRRNLRLTHYRDSGSKELRPGTLLDPSCKMLIRGLNGSYRTADRLSPTGKTKFKGGVTQHLIDALRYVAHGTFRLATVGAA